MVVYDSVNRLFEESFRKYWERPALSNYQGVTLCYKDVAGMIRSLHLFFESSGLKKGDKVALCSRNQANWGVCFLASMTYGAVPVPILHEFKAENIQYLVNHSDAKILFVDDVIWDGLTEMEMPGIRAIVQVNDLSVLYSKDETVSITPCAEGFGPDDVKYFRDSPEELAIISYTSGTSGFSKGVMIPYRAILCNFRFAGETAEPQMNCESEVVAMLPSAHMYGLMFELLFEMSIGAHVHFLTRVPSPKIIMKAFEDIRPDIIIAVPLIIEKVYKSQLKGVADRSRILRYFPVLGRAVRKRIRKELVDSFGGRFEEVILGGAPFNPEVEDFLRSVNFPFTVGYGMTECAPLITYSKWSRSKSGSCGVPITGCDVRIVSDDPKNEPGEIQVRGENVFQGYYKNAQATEEVFTDGGWFRTGDIGVVDDEGYLYIRGRSKCMILGSSGQNIYPEELEAVINNASYVMDSLVIEDTGGLTALIYPDYHLAEKDGISRDDLVSRMTAALPGINEALPSYAHIRKVEIMSEDFERTPKRSIKRYLYQRN